MINGIGILFLDTKIIDTEESIFCGGEGSTENPYLICNANQLNNIRNGMSLNYKINNNIDVNVHPYNAGEGWEPIGTETDRFTGTLDGNGKVINGIYINRPDQDYIGLFGYINALPGNESWVRNLGINNINVTGNNFTGGLVGRIVGSWNAEAVVQSVFVFGNVIGGGSTGGIAGYTAYKSILENVYSRTNIVGGWGRGGIVGSHWGGALIINSYSASEISAGSGAGGIFGQGTASNVTNSYWNIDLYPTSPAGAGKTTTEMLNVDTFSFWNISTSNNDRNNGYPYLAWEDNRIDFIWLIYE